MSKALASADRRFDGSSSRPSKNNRQGYAHRPERSDFDIRRHEYPEEAPTGIPIAARTTKLREEAAAQKDPETGHLYPVTEDFEVPANHELVGRPVRAVVEEWRDWYKSYESAHLTFENDEGEVVRSQLENSHQPRYAKRYYARLKDLERGINRRYESLTTAMLTFTNSHQNAEGFPRAPVDLMREIAGGWDTARKHLYQSLSDRNWEYAKIWEPHKDGYGHLHVAIFVEGEAEAADFKKTMASYVENVQGAGREAHSLENAVSVNDSVENLGSYISEYLGAFQDEGPLDRPVTEQIFRATVWASNTRRLDFSNGAQEIIAGEKFRRETGLRPEDRGSVSEGTSEGATEGAEAASEASESDGSEWEVAHVEYVEAPRIRNRTNPTAGGVRTVTIDHRPEVDPPPTRS